MITVSIITVVFNREKTIRRAIESLNAQDYKHIEHIIVDGGSTDGTLRIVKDSISSGATLLSEPDTGIYNAINKGIGLATGDVIGVLHSDDYYPNATVISDVVTRFRSAPTDMVYGDLNYIRGDTGKIIRRWKAGSFRRSKLFFGWMPPHPSVYVSRDVYNRFGYYEEKYRISADYDFMARVLRCSSLATSYLARDLMNMSVGGASNKGIKQLRKKSSEDLIIARQFSSIPYVTLVLKNLRKLTQFRIF